MNDDKLRQVVLEMYQNSGGDLTLSDNDVITLVVAMIQTIHGAELEKQREQMKLILTENQKQNQLFLEQMQKQHENQIRELKEAFAQENLKRDAERRELLIALGNATEFKTAFNNECEQIVDLGKKASNLAKTISQILISIGAGTVQNENNGIFSKFFKK